MVLRYGHLWSLIEKFFVCFALSKRASDRLVLFVPARVQIGGSKPKRVPVMRELTSLLGGAPDFLIERADWVPLCRAHATSRSSCCAANMSASEAAVHDVATAVQLWVTPSYDHPFVGGLSHVRNGHAALRSHIWRSLGAEDVVADTVLFVSSRASSNGRRLVHEAEVASALRCYFAMRYPWLRYVHEDLQRLNYSDELRLVRRSVAVVALFGSALHNCRVLPSGALLIELHGALKTDVGYSDVYRYGELCSRLGVRWIGYHCPGALPSGSAHAAVNVSALLEVVHAATHSDWEHSLGVYAKGYHRSNWSRTQRATPVKHLLSQPQYRSEISWDDEVRRAHEVARQDRASNARVDAPTPQKWGSASAAEGSRAGVQSCVLRPSTPRRESDRARRGQGGAWATLGGSSLWSWWAELWRRAHRHWAAPSSLQLHSL